jgi:YesN/AraC family two-component response regulator
MGYKNDVVVENIQDNVNREIHNILIQNRQYMLYHHTPLYERYLLQYVKEGDKDKLLNHLSKVPDGQIGTLSKDPLRNIKNLFICGATLVSRAAIEGGLNSELAFTISDSYIQQAEELTKVDEVASLYYQLICDFTDRVHNIRKKNYSGIILECCNYIFKHLYENINVSHLSKIVGVNPNYLSSLFKKEVGISLSKYIQRERIEEAKKLLSLTNQSILDICVSLNFSDQSYFTKVFKEFAQMTPKQYRNEIKKN